MRFLAALLAAAGIAAAAVPAGRAADECNGLMVCIPIEGPWVVVPAAAPSTVEWQLKCPEGTVGGLDARVANPLTDILFDGLVGSPVNPGITTRDAVVFTGRATSLPRRATSFKPFIGCIPAAGGGRTPTAVKPGSPTIFRVSQVPVFQGILARGTLSCHADERLLAASTAIGLRTTLEPTAAELGAVRVRSVVRGNRILVSATRHGLGDSVSADVQIQALCTRGARP